MMKGEKGLTALASIFALSTVFAVPKPVIAFGLSLIGSPTSLGNGLLQWTYEIDVQGLSSEQILKGDVLKIAGVNITQNKTFVSGDAVAGKFGSWQVSNAGEWTATTNSQTLKRVSFGRFAIQSTNPSGTVSWDYYNGSQNINNGQIAGPVPPAPEPFTILGSGMALGFGVLMERRYSRKRNKLAQQREIEKV